MSPVNVNVVTAGGVNFAISAPLTQAASTATATAQAGSAYVTLIGVEFCAIRISTTVVHTSHVKMAAHARIQRRISTGAPVPTAFPDLPAKRWITPAPQIHVSMALLVGKLERALSATALLVLRGHFVLQMSTSVRRSLAKMAVHASMEKMNSAAIVLRRGRAHSASSMWMSVHSLSHPARIQ